MNIRIKNLCKLYYRINNDKFNSHEYCSFKHLFLIGLGVIETDLRDLLLIYFHSSIPRQILEYISTFKIDGIKQAVILFLTQDSNILETRYEQYRKSSYEFVKEQFLHVILRNPSTPLTLLRKEIKRRGLDLDHIGSIALNPSLDDNLFESLSRKQNDYVKFGLVENRSTPEHIIRRIAKSEALINKDLLKCLLIQKHISDKYKNIAVKKYINHPLTTYFDKINEMSYTLDTFKVDLKIIEEFLKSKVLSNPYLKNHYYELLLKIVRKRKDLTGGMIQFIISKNGSKECLYEIAKHKNTPKNILVSLTKNKNANISDLARNNLKENHGEI